MNITRQRRVAAGRCIDCEKPVAQRPDGSRPRRCPSCSKRASRDVMAWRRKASGGGKLCPRCRTRKPRKGVDQNGRQLVHCWKCTYAIRERDRLSRQARKAAANG